MDHSHQLSIVTDCFYRLLHIGDLLEYLLCEDPPTVPFLQPNEGVLLARDQSQVHVREIAQFQRFATQVVDVLQQLAVSCTGGSHLSLIFSLKSSWLTKCETDYETNLSTSGVLGLTEDLENWGRMDPPAAFSLSCA